MMSVNSSLTTDKTDQMNNIDKTMQNEEEIIVDDADKTENEEELELDLEDEEDVDELKKTIETLKIQKAKYKEKYIDLVSKKPEPQKFNKPNPKKDDDYKVKVDSLLIAEEKRQFGYQNGLSPEETDYIFKINSKPSKELLEDPFIKGGLEAIRSAKRVDDNTPSISGRSQRFELPKKKADLTRDEKQEAFEKFTQSRLRR